MGVKIKSKSQSSIEFFIIVGIGLAIFLPTVAIFFAQAVNSQERVAAKQAERAVTAITAAADQVYYMGYPARKTIKIYLPAQVKDFAINNHSVSLTLESSFGDYEVVSWSAATLNGSLQATPGIKLIEVQAFKNYVNISSY